LKNKKRQKNRVKIGKSRKKFKKPNKDVLRNQHSEKKKKGLGES
jgi:hypothetical protein